MTRQRKLRHYLRLENSYQYCTDCSKEPNGTPKLTYLPIKQWASANNRTVRECESLLKRRILAAISLKGRLYVALIGDLDDFC